VEWFVPYAVICALSVPHDSCTRDNPDATVVVGVEQSTPQTCAIVAYETLARTHLLTDDEYVRVSCKRRS
jgi:hypothetical protein